MDNRKRISWIAGGALLLGIVGLSGCASKRYVGEEVSKSSAASEKRRRF